MSFALYAAAASGLIGFSFVWHRTVAWPAIRQLICDEETERPG